MQNGGLKQRLVDMPGYEKAEDKKMGLKGSVGANKRDGRKSENYPNDVLCVRNLLNIHIKYNPVFVKERFTQLPVIGTTKMSETIRAIKTFQMHVLSSQKPTGRIDPGDNTLKALVLEEGVNRPTEPLAPIADQIHNQLIRALHSSDLNIFDSDKGREGELKAMIKLLLYDPKADDSYIRDRYFEGNSELKDKRLEEYIKKAEPNTVPRAINFTCSVRGLMKTPEGKLKFKSTEEVVRFLARVSDEMYVSYSQYQLYIVETLSMRSSIYGPKAAATNLEIWFRAKFADPHSIYHCFPSLDRPSAWFNGPAFLQ